MKGIGCPRLASPIDPGAPLYPPILAPAFSPGKSEQDLQFPLSSSQRSLTRMREQRIRMAAMNDPLPLPLRSCLLLLPLICLVGCSSSTNPAASLPPPAPPITEQENPADPQSGKFAPGDTLELFVKEDPSLNGSYPVREGGYIVIPRAGRVQVSGLGREGAESAIKDYLQRTQLTQASVLVERTPARNARATAVGGPPGIPKIMVYITGNVPRSGVHFVPVTSGRQPGVYETLLVTGGTSRFTHDQRIELHRLDSTGTRRRAVIDLRPIKEGKSPDVPVGDGDIIHVPEKVFGF